MTRESPAQLPRSALGYTARRCGEAGPALVARRLRILFVIGVEQRSPRWDGRKVAAVSDRLSQPFQCPDRSGMVLAAKHRFGFCGWVMAVRFASHRVYRQLIGTGSNATAGA